MNHWHQCVEISAAPLGSRLTIDNKADGGLPKVFPKRKQSASLLFGSCFERNCLNFELSVPNLADAFRSTRSLAILSPIQFHALLQVTN